MLLQLEPIEILLTIFAVFAWSRVFLKFRGKLMNAKEFAFWSIVWITAIVVVYIPGKTNFIARYLGMDRGFDAFTFIGMVTIFYAVYRLYAKVNEQDQIITELVRQIALKNGTIKSRRKK